MKKFLTLVCVSALGGALTLGAYKHFFEASEIRKLLKTNLSSPVSCKLRETL